MKKYFYVVILYLLMSCSKNDVTTNNPTPTPNPVNYTNTPQPSPFVGDILLSNIVGNTQYTNPSYVRIGNTYLDLLATGFGYQKANTSLDKYNTTIKYEPQASASGSDIEFNRTLAFLDAQKNYADVKPFSLTTVGYFIYPNMSGSFNLPNGGEIYLPPYSFISLTSTPITASCYVYAKYFHPTINEFSLMSPSYPMADINGKRWYLNSYGMYFLQTWTTNTQYLSDFASNTGVKIKIPITNSQYALAPDSIQCWNFGVNNKWTLNGYAKKVGLFYEKVIDKKGYWNFAVPLDGVYITINLKTPKDLSLANTRFIVRNGESEISDNRTDINGSALIFVPIGSDLQIEVLNDHNTRYSSIPSSYHIQNLGTFNKLSTKDIIVPFKLNSLFSTIEGTAYDCNGSILNNGFVLIKGNRDEYKIPIVNGVFKFCNWYEGDIGYSDVKILNNQGLVLNNSRVVVSGASYDDNVNDRVFNVNLYNCSSHNFIFFNYFNDNVLNKINGNTQTSIQNATFSLMPPPNNANTYMFSFKENNLSVKFQVILTSSGYHFLSQTMPYNINGVDYNRDTSSDLGELILTKNEYNTSGIVEGWVSLSYKDANGSKHTLRGNFRAKKS